MQWTRVNRTLQEDATESGEDNRAGKKTVDCTHRGKNLKVGCPSENKAEGLMENSGGQKASLWK